MGPTPSLDALSDQLRGPVILPDDPEYDDARAVYNAMHDCRPAAVVMAEDDADVMATVRFARDEGLTLVG